MAGNVLVYPDTGLAPGTYTWAVTAVTSTGLESARATITQTLKAAAQAAPKSPTSLKAVITVDPATT